MVSDVAAGAADSEDSYDGAAAVMCAKRMELIWFILLLPKMGGRGRRVGLCLRNMEVVEHSTRSLPFKKLFNYVVQ